MRKWLKLKQAAVHLRMGHPTGYKLADEGRIPAHKAGRKWRFDPEEWGGRKAKTSLEGPGQVRSLEAPRQGEGWIFLDWKAPTDGGTVAAYKVQRRERPSGPWTHAGFAMETETTLRDQKRGKEWEYRVIAVNKAAEGQPSNTVMGVLWRRGGWSATLLVAVGRKTVAWEMSRRVIG